MPPPSDDRSSLEAARERLYAPSAPAAVPEHAAPDNAPHALPHAWENPVMKKTLHPHIRLAGLFFSGALLFFLVALGVAAYFLYFGGNSVSVNNVDVQMQGPTSIAGGDTMPLSLAITNKNPTALQNAQLEVDFPPGTRSADNLLQDYPRYTENLGTVAPGTTVTRTIRAVIFGAEGQQLTIPVSVTFGAQGSNATFVKKTSYALAISSAPLSVSVNAPMEAVSGQPLPLSFTVRSNASSPIENVVASMTLPFGYTLASSSVPVSGSSFMLGTLAPGESRTVELAGTLVATDGAARAFNVSVGTASAPSSSAIAISYMTQSAPITVAAPFIETTYAVNGDSSGNAVVAPGSTVVVSLNYLNTLATAVTNASISVQISGDAVDYNSVKSTTGFYQSTTHTITFDSGTSPALSSLSPGASGAGSFTFNTVPASAGAKVPLITFTTSISGTRVGQANVPEQVTASSVASAKIVAMPSLAEATLHANGPFKNTGPIPPAPGTATTYTIEWRAAASGTALAGASVSATLPSYVTYTGQTSGAGSFSYDPNTRMVTWTAGDLTEGGTTVGDFQVSLLPSTSQKGSAPALTSPATLSAFDRYTQTNVTATADPATTETPGDPGYTATKAPVQ